MNRTDINMQLPVILVIGATGLTGSLLVQELDYGTNMVHVRLAARSQEKVDRLRAEGRDAVLLDLDVPSTFAYALAGVSRVFLLTSYSVAMLSQSKTIIDAAKKAGVEHIVHLGVFGNWDCTDPHFAWHQLVERYIEASGVSWTHLHPNMFMDQLPVFMKIREDAFSIYWGEKQMGFIASRDVAAVAAKVLIDGPTKHRSQDYWLSAEVASGNDLARIFSEVLSRPIRCELKTPDAFETTMKATGDYTVEAWYAAGASEFIRQVFDGRMGYVATVRDDSPFLTGRSSITLRQWAEANRTSF